MLITIDIQPDALAPQIIDAYARSFGWRSVAQDGDVGAYARAKLIESIMATLEQQRGEEAANVARAAAVAEVRRLVTIT